jgi:hypothetical protein
LIPKDAKYVEKDRLAAHQPDCGAGIEARAGEAYAANLLTLA